MSNLLTIPFSKIRSEGNYKEILEALERGFSKFGIDFYLVGATARDVWMKGVHEKPPKRATSDIDFGIMIKDSGIFADLKNYFISGALPEFILYESEIVIPASGITFEYDALAVIKSDFELFRAPGFISAASWYDVDNIKLRGASFFLKE